MYYNFSMIKITDNTYQIFNTAQNPRLAEQDYLECAVLNALFTDDYIRENFVFTGGATLSKSYGIGGRIGRDIDLALVNFTDLPNDRTKKQLSNFRKAFKKFTFGDLRDRVAQVINDDNRFKIITDRDWPSPENTERMASCPALHMLYESELGTGHLCLEITPRHYSRTKIQHHSLIPYSINSQIGTPIPTVSYEQTFWDKVFALHSNARAVAPHCDKCFSRHYYDVAALAPHVDLDGTYKMLNDTVAYQSRHTTKDINLSHARDAILVPDDKTLYKLADDYYAMSGTFIGTQTSWDTIVQTLQNLTQDLRTIKKQRG